MEKETDCLLADAYMALGLSEGASAEEVVIAYDTALREARRDDRGWERAKEIDRAFEILRKHLPDRPSEGASGLLRAARESDEDAAGPLKTLFFPPPHDVTAVSYWPRVVFFLVLAAWGSRFIFAPIQGDYVGRSFMHLINLPFHEAGHVFFSFLGDFLRVLGGTLAQLILPIVCLVAFLRQAEVFGASCCLWWTGQSFIDAAPYIYDARAGQLILLGGVTGQDNPDFHDWHNILGKLGLLTCDHAFAYGAKFVGASLIILSFCWGLWALLRQYESLRGSR